MIDLVLFYSQHCQHCKNVMMAIQKSSLQNSIKMFCIDGFQPLPKYLTHVPSLKSYKQNSIIIGDDIIQWLDSKKQPLDQRIEDQVAQSTGGYTMIGDDGSSNVNEIDAAYNARISTPQGQIPSQEGPKSFNDGISFPQDMARMQSGGLDMAYEKMMKEREAQFPTSSPQSMDQQFTHMMDQKNAQMGGGVTTL
jgi:hypothetical protein